MTTIDQIHQVWAAASGQPLRATVWDRGIDHFIKAGFTEADVMCVFKYARRENAKFTGAIQGFTITPFKVFDFEYRWFDSLLSQARASERNRRPAPTPKERVMALRDPLLKTEETNPRNNGAGRHISEIFNKNITNQ